MCQPSGLKVENARIIAHRSIAKDVYQMDLQTSIASCAKPGQFLQIQLDGFLLRRPISICSIEGNDCLRILYKVVGNGTKKLSSLQEGAELNLFGSLGNGFPIYPERKEILIFGGGIGTPPLYELAKQYQKYHAKVTVILGFASKKEVFYEQEFQDLGCRVWVTTMDGSYGIKGTCFDALSKVDGFSDPLVYGCGPLGLLRALENRYTDGYLSYEARMTCGIGACMACVAKDREEAQRYHRICKEGPVFPIGKVMCE